MAGNLEVGPALELGEVEVGISRLCKQKVIKSEVRKCQLVSAVPKAKKKRDQQLCKKVEGSNGMHQKSLV